MYGLRERRDGINKRERKLRWSTRRIPSRAWLRAACVPLRILSEALEWKNEQRPSEDQRI